MQLTRVLPIAEQNVGAISCIGINFLAAVGIPFKLAAAGVEAQNCS